MSRPALKECDTLENQPDFNRIWFFDKPELMPPFARQLMDWGRQHKIFASIDVHNNTGKNPFYGCVTETSTPTLYLASLFSRQLVFFENPKYVFSRAMSEFGPSITIECGMAGNPQSADAAFNYIWDCLNLSHAELSQPKHNDYEIYKTIGRLVVNPLCSFGFDDSTADISFRQDIDHYNFTELKPGFEFAHIRETADPLAVLDEDQANVFDDFFIKDGNRILVNTRTYPTMLTKRRSIVQSDCLGYLMKRFTPE